MNDLPELPPGYKWMNCSDSDLNVYIQDPNGQKTENAWDYLISAAWSLATGEIQKFVAPLHPSSSADLVTAETGIFDRNQAAGLLAVWACMGMLE